MWILLFIDFFPLVTKAISFFLVLQTPGVAEVGQRAAGSAAQQLEPEAVFRGVGALPVSSAPLLTFEPL